MVYPSNRQPCFTKTLIYFIGLGVCTIVCTVGCRETSQVKSLPFEQRNQPTIHEQGPTVASSGEAAAEGFLHKDFFFAVSVDVRKLLGSNVLEGMDLSEVQRALANWVGDRAANLANYRRLWVLVDQSLTSALGGGTDASANPLAIVLEWNEPLESWQALFPQSGGGGDVSELVDLKRDSLFAARIDSRHLAIASREMALRLTRPRETGNLQRLAESTKSSHVLQAYFDPQPIAGFFSTIAQMARSFGGGNDEAFQIYTAVKHATLAIDPEQSEMVQLSISLQDPRAADQIAQSLNEAFANDNRQPSQNSLAGMGNGLAPRRNSATMYEPQVLTQATALFDDIVQRDLAEVSKTADQVELRIRRSEAVKPFLQTAVSDLQQIATLSRRIEAGRQLASAVARFHAERGRLPTDGPPDPNGKGPPFSWRVAILPQLGRQDLYDRIDFLQPWDSPTNQEVAEDVPEVFAALDPAGKTAWRLSRGPGRLYNADSDQPPSLDRITDPKNRTAIIVETSRELAVPWMAPDSDLPDEIVEKDYGQRADAGWLFIDAEFRLRGIKKTASNIEAVLTVAGRERINRADLIVLPEPDPAKPQAPPQLD